MRNQMTPAETQLWKIVKNRQFHGKKFRRQHGIGPFVVDFYCSEDKLIVELDGEAHSGLQNREYDGKRQEKLQEMGYTVLRFENQQIFKDIENVLACIAHCLSGIEGT